MTAYIKTCITFLLWALIMPIFILICLLLSFLPKHREQRILFFTSHLWGATLLLTAHVWIKVRNQENIPDNPAIIVMNHTSCLDIFFLEQLLGSHPRLWLIKKEYGKYPIFSTLIKRMHILVDRANPRAAAHALARVYDQSKKNNSHVLIFPEGKRYADGAIHDFKPGFAILAKKLNRPVIPIALHGMHKIFPKGSWVITPRSTQPYAMVGAPLFIKKDESINVFVQRVHSWFES